ncbi:uncharacterized protein LOC110229035 [Arabidopsis lyrata subsp. lyrata]|uniref:uncharacterized protein LOC110229035 n=1 Tax=Arabidopsis lyrata subsp. lyrata TaxID=81972 RepID=UPI000A29E69D|nr:uncharacterized protein LOC110229035 [Arabidopsis lyrata subsp. lyrata]|eukprot:XP_020883429.1 uncharacterized protein LOC110229035 [Arabidopsis lyrata subsp. lyrata]
MLVKDLLDPVTNEWNPAAIRSTLPQYEDAIRSINTNNLQLHDSLIWLPEKSGIYSTKTGYHLAANGSFAGTEPPKDFSWTKSIWQLKVIPKIKNFLWKASNGALSLGSNLAKRGLMTSLCCKRCGEREDELHLFLHCPYTQRVWSAAPLYHHFLAGTFPNFQALLTKALLSVALPPLGLYATPMAPWIMWNLWKARNLLIFEDIAFSEQDIILKSLKEANEWQSAQLALPKQRARPVAPLTTQHNIPTHKCYVDAAWSAPTGNCGQGWILLDPLGNTLIRSSMSRGFVGSALSAEALAIRSSLTALSRSPILASIRRLEVHSDSQVLISILNSKASSKELKAIIHDIFCLSTKWSSISFIFVPRLDNVISDSLAKTALIAANSSSLRGV